MRGQRHGQRHWQHHWQIVPTAQGRQLLVDGRPIGSSAEPPPSGWLQRMFGFTMPLAYEVARRQCRGYAGRAQNAERCYMVSYAKGSHAGGEEVWDEIPCEEHALPPGTCMNNLGCIAMPMDCATREPLRLPMECPEGWLVLHKPDCGGEVVGCIAPDEGCELVWTYEAEECPPGYLHDGWHWAEDGEDLARVCCPTGVPHPNWTGRPGIDPVMYESRTVAGGEGMVPEWFVEQMESA